MPESVYMEKSVCIDSDIEKISGKINLYYWKGKGEIMITNRDMLYDDIAGILDNLDNWKIVNIHNDFCDGDDWIYNMSDFDEIMDNMTAMDVANRVFYGDFNPNNDYFKFDGYANLESTDYPTDFVDMDILINYAIDNDYDYDIDEIRELLDEYYYDDDDDDDSFNF